MSSTVIRLVSLTVIRESVLREKDTVVLAVWPSAHTGGCSVLLADSCLGRGIRSDRVLICQKLSLSDIFLTLPSWSQAKHFCKLST